MTHLTFERISELAESDSASRESLAESRESLHIAECADCRAMLLRVRELVGAARALPRDIAPPVDVWMALRARVAAESMRSRRRWWHNGWLASAAAIVLVVGTAVIATNAAPKAKASKIARETPIAAPVTPALGAVEANYAGTLVQLREALEAERGKLSPSTLRTVERSLAVIDSAIAEARAALASDPANSALVDILSAHYERKVELLQRATELSSL
jgi:hypothetical protein